MTVPASEKNGLLRDWQRRIAADLNAATLALADVVSEAQGSYTPTLTSLSVGTTGATNTASWVYVGGPASGDVGLMHVVGRLLWGTAGTRTFPTNLSRIALPTGFEGYTWYTNDYIVGQCRMRDVSAGTTALGDIQLVGGSSAQLRPIVSVLNGSYINSASPTATTPFTWADGDSLNWAATMYVKRS